MPAELLPSVPAPNNALGVLRMLALCCGMDPATVIARSDEGTVPIT